MEQISRYFDAEKNESILFILVGLVAVSLSIYFLVKLNLPFYKGMAYPLIAIALIQIVVGSTVYVRSPKDIIRVHNILREDPSKIKSEELPRMEVVMKNFVLYRWIEIGLIMLGLILFLFFSENALWKGIGLGLAIQAAFMLLLDFFAEKRGHEYFKYLMSLQ